MKNVLVVGSGAREVAIARCVSQSSIKNSLFCVSKDINPQIVDLCKDYFVTDLTNISDIVSYSTKTKVDLAIIGPENPLANGIVNELENVGVGCVGQHPCRHIIRAPHEHAPMYAPHAHAT